MRGGSACIKAVVLKFLSRQDKDIPMLVFFDLAGVSSSGKLRRRAPLGVSCLKIAGLDGIRSRATMFFLTVWFQREQCEALQSVAIVGHAFNSMVKSVAENGMEAEIW